MMFHGNPIPADEDPMVHWRIKSQANEDARQQFLEGYVPQVWELGLTLPDPKLRRGDDGVWEYTEPDWDRLMAVVSGNGPHRPSGSPSVGSRAPRSTGSRARCSPTRHDPRSSTRSSAASARGSPMQHAGSIAAPDERFAEIYAREQYGRRGESEALWLVPRDAVRRSTSSSTSSTSSTAAWTATRSRSG